MGDMEDSNDTHITIVLVCVREMDVAACHVVLPSAGNAKYSLTDCYRTTNTI